MLAGNPPIWRTTPKKVADQAPRPLRAAEKRPLSVRLLGGLVVYLTTLYCGPKRRTGEGRGREGGGLYTELSVLGFSEGTSPALVSRVGRATALLPSFATARNELAIEGVNLNIKEVYRISKQLGSEMLTTRCRDLKRYRSGALPVGDELRGKRVGVAIDGGRVRTRKLVRKQKGRGKNKKQRRKMSVEWREPKLLIIFEMDDKGRMKPKTRPWIDATFQGPDACMELLAMHLHRLGAAKADLVVFLSDGAPWIWDRLEWVQKRVGLNPYRVMKVLDFCHAVHQMSLALKALNLPKSRHDELYPEFRHKLYKSQALEVSGQLSVMAEEAKLPEKDEGWASIRFLENHAAGGHLQYQTFRRRGVPMGSGAVESAIRRVVNLRLKGNGIMWEVENAEGMLALRAAAVTNRWEETLRHVRETMSRDRSLGWDWQPPDMTEELKAKIKIEPPKPIHQENKAKEGLAA
jgi:hypothetical protein